MVKLHLSALLHSLLHCCASGLGLQGSGDLLSSAHWHWIPRSVQEQGLKSPEPGSTLSVSYRQSGLGQGCSAHL